jgi:hypothetical protein
LPEALGSDGTTITVGDPDAETRVQLYEDPRCPVCEEFETTGGGPRLQEAMLDHRVRTEYTLASFLDDRLGGSGSKKAVKSAVRPPCACDVLADLRPPGRTLFGLLADPAGVRLPQGPLHCRTAHGCLLTGLPGSVFSRR